MGLFGAQPFTGRFREMESAFGGLPPAQHRTGLTLLTKKKSTYQKKSVTSKDGTTIGFRQLGHGPRVVILHGADQLRRFFGTDTM
jgi:hypothetical protein